MKLSMLILVCAVSVCHWLGTNGSSNKRKTEAHLWSKKSKQVPKKRPTTLLTMTESTPVGMTSVKNPPSNSALTAVTGDGSTDDTSAIKAFINHVAGTANKKLFFPPGEYIVSDNILLGDSVELHGSVDGMSVLKTTPSKSYNVVLGTVDASVTISNVVIKNLFFDGLLVQFSGALRRDPCRSAPSALTRRAVTVTKNVFFSSVASSRSVAKQLFFQRPVQSEVSYNVFLRDSRAFGVGTQFCRTSSVTVKHNIFGLDLTKIEWIGRELGTPFWTKQKEKLAFLKTHYALSPDQGYFKSSIYGTLDRNMVIEENVFNGSPNTGTLHKDHVLYVKGFNGMKIIRNYARGWPTNPTGGIKARNAKNLVIARNYIDGTGIYIYSHAAKKTPFLYGGLKNVVIYGNHLVVRRNYGRTKSGIAYWEPTRHGPGVDENIKYSANEFEFPTVQNPTGYRCIFLANGDRNEHHVYRDNVYYQTTTTVRLTASRNPRAFESGTIDTSISSKYGSMSVYKLNIPTY